MSTYPSKRDWWLAFLLWSLAVFFTCIAFTVHAEPVAPWMKAFATCFFAVLSLLTTSLAILPYFTSYTLDPVNLTIRMGPFRSRIAIARITEVFPIKNPLLSPNWRPAAAWSLDRLKIRYTGSRFGAMISPVGNQAFLEELALLVPHLQLKGEKMILQPQLIYAKYQFDPANGEIDQAFHFAPGYCRHFFVFQRRSFSRFWNLHLFRD